MKFLANLSLRHFTFSPFVFENLTLWRNVWLSDKLVKNKVEVKISSKTHAYKTNKNNIFKFSFIFSIFFFFILKAFLPFCCICVYKEQNILITINIIIVCVCMLFLSKIFSQWNWNCCWYWGNNVFACVWVYFQPFPLLVKYIFVYLLYVTFIYNFLLFLF